MPECPSCRADNPDTAQYCRSCGKTLGVRRGLPTGLLVGIALVGVVAVIVLIAVLASLKGNRPPGRAPADVKAQTDAWREVEPLARGYYEAGVNHEVDKELGYWQFPAENYFDWKNHAYEDVRREAQGEARKKTLTHKLILQRPVAWDSTRKRLTVEREYWIRFVSDKGKTISGTDNVRLEWARTATGWKIVAAYGERFRND